MSIEATTTPHLTAGGERQHKRDLSIRVFMVFADGLPVGEAEWWENGINRFDRSLGVYINRARRAKDGPGPIHVEAAIRAAIASPSHEETP